MLVSVFLYALHKIYEMLDGQKLGESVIYCCLLRILDIIKLANTRPKTELLNYLIQLSR